MPRRFARIPAFSLIVTTGVSTRSRPAWRWPSVEHDQTEIEEGAFLQSLRIAMVSTSSSPTPRPVRTGTAGRSGTCRMSFGSLVATREVIDSIVEEVQASI